MKIERLIIGGAALLVGLLLGWMVRGVATYNVHQASIATYDDWRVACPAAEATAENVAAHCELSTDVVDKSQGTPNAVARATITTDKDGKQLIGFVLPYGVALEAGMGLKIGKDPVKVYQYRTCNTIGCIVTTPFDDKLVRQAVYWAIDRTQIRDVAYSGAGEVGIEEVPTGSTWYDGAPQVEPDLDKARSLLQQAGFGNGLTVEYLGLPQYPELLKTGQVVREPFAALE